MGSRTSFNKLSKALGLAVDTVKEYVDYLGSAFLVTSLEKWTTSYSEKVYASKKIYLSDTGMKTLITGAGDLGSKAETAVVMELQRRKCPSGYFAESEREVDFVLGQENKPFPIEAKFLSAFDWKDRRFAGIKLFLRRFPQTRKALILTRNVVTELKVNGTRIVVLPLWRFLISPDLYLPPL